MNTIKTLFLIALLGIAPALRADVISTEKAAGHGTSGSLVASNSVYIQSITLNNGTGSAITVELFDSPNTNVTFSIGAYTNRISYISNIVTTVVGITGHTNLLTNSVLVEAANAVSAATANRRSITKVTVPANLPITLSLNTIAGSGVLITNNGTIGVTMQYQRLR